MGTATLAEVRLLGLSSYLELSDTGRLCRANVPQEAVDLAAEAGRLTL